MSFSNEFFLVRKDRSAIGTNSDKPLDLRDRKIKMSVSDKTFAREKRKGEIFPRQCSRWRDAPHCSDCTVFLFNQLDSTRRYQISSESRSRSINPDTTPHQQQHTTSSLCNAHASRGWNTNSQYPLPVCFRRNFNLNLATINSRME